MIIAAPLEFGISVESIERCLPFYVEHLGLKVVARRSVDSSRSKPIAYSEHGYRVVKLQSPFGERFKLLQSLSPGGRQVERDIHMLTRPGQTFLSVIVQDLGSIVGRLERGGAAFRTDPHIIQWEADVQVTVVDDPEGNPVELCQFDHVRRYRPDLVAAKGPGGTAKRAYASEEETS